MQVHSKSRMSAVQQQSWQRADQRLAVLEDAELFWSARQAGFLAAGYALRSRYQPGWVPSWRESREQPSLCEDGLVSPTAGKVMDAFRLSDRRRVALKRVDKEKGVNEVDIHAYLSSLPHPDNITVPLLEVLDLGSEDTDVFLVFPLLQSIEDGITWENEAEVLEFCQQLLKGVAFLHRHGVIHGDIGYGNVMMVTEPLYPKGHHPARPPFNATDFKREAEHLRRSDGCEQYHLIDFGRSIHFPSYEERRPMLFQGGQDQTAPELRLSEPIDGFALDVYRAGNLLRTLFVERYPQLQRLLGELVDSMTCENPADRFTADESSAYFLRNVWPTSLHRPSPRLRACSESFIEGIRAHAIYHLGNLWRTSRPAHFRELLTCHIKYQHLPYPGCAEDDEEQIELSTLSAARSTVSSKLASLLALLASVLMYTVLGFCSVASRAIALIAVLSKDQLLRLAEL